MLGLFSGITAGGELAPSLGRFVSLSAMEETNSEVLDPCGGGASPRAGRFFCGCCGCRCPDSGASGVAGANSWPAPNEGLNVWAFLLVLMGFLDGGGVGG